jgi:hypothetical protein
MSVDNLNFLSQKVNSLLNAVHVVYPGFESISYDTNLKFEINVWNYLIKVYSRR